MSQKLRWNAPGFEKTPKGLFEAIDVKVAGRPLNDETLLRDIAAETVLDVTLKSPDLAELAKAISDLEHESVCPSCPSLHHPGHGHEHFENPATPRSRPASSPRVPSAAETLYNSIKRRFDQLDLEAHARMIEIKADCIIGGPKRTIMVDLRKGSKHLKVRFPFELVTWQLK
jgi:hypothetical protein